MSREGGGGGGGTNSNDIKKAWVFFTYSHVTCPVKSFSFPFINGNYVLRKAVVYQQHIFYLSSKYFQNFFGSTLLFCHCSW